MFVQTQKSQSLYCPWDFAVRENWVGLSSNVWNQFVEFLMPESISCLIGLHKPPVASGMVIKIANLRIGQFDLQFFLKFD